jgi:hypothetical protein
MISGSYGLQSIVAAVVVGLFVYGPWQWYTTDNARQRLFVQRNRLFDIADAGRINFDSEAYRGLRAHVESLIRFGHNLTLPSFLYFWFRASGFRVIDGSGGLVRLISAIEDRSVREEFFDVYDRCGKQIVFMLLEKSFFLTALLSLFYYASNRAFLSIKLVRRVKAWVSLNWGNAAQTAHALSIFEAASQDC